MAEEPSPSQPHIARQIYQFPASQAASQLALHPKERSSSTGHSKNVIVDGSACLTQQQPVTETPAAGPQLLAPRPQYRPAPSNINSDAAREAMKLCNCFNLTTDELGGVDRIQRYFIEPLLRVPGTGNIATGESSHMPPIQPRLRFHALSICGLLRLSQTQDVCTLELFEQSSASSASLILLMFALAVHARCSVPADFPC